MHPAEIQWIMVLTPCTCVGVVDGGIDVSEVDFAHEAIDLCGSNEQTRVGGARRVSSNEHKAEAYTYIQLPGEACEAGLTIYTRQDMQCKLLWSLYDDMFSCWIPADHMMIFRTL